MLCLDMPTESRWHELGEGVRVLSKPLTTALSIAAESYALRERDRIRAAAKAAGVPDPFAAEDLGTGLAYEIRMQSLAAMMLEAWEGVGAADGSGPAALTPETAAALMRHHKMATEFDRKISAPLAELAAEGNGSALSPSTISAQGANTVRAAASPSGRSAKPVRTGRKPPEPPMASPPGSPGDPA